jgi:hypothetical protein
MYNGWRSKKENKKKKKRERRESAKRFLKELERKAKISKV